MPTRPDQTRQTRFAPPRRMSGFDLLLTTSTVIAGTIAAGLFIRSTVLDQPEAEPSAGLMRLVEPATESTGQDTAAATFAPTVISARAERDAAIQDAAIQDAAIPQVRPAQETLRYDDRPIKLVKTLTMKVTAYSPDERSCGKWADGITFSGKSVYTNGMQLVAADRRLLPLHSLVSVPGYADGRPVPVLDIGGAIKGNRLDVLFPTHEEALAWGVRTIKIKVYGYAD